MPGERFKARAGEKVSRELNEKITQRRRLEGSFESVKTGVDL